MPGVNLGVNKSEPPCSHDNLLAQKALRPFVNRVNQVNRVNRE